MSEKSTRDDARRSTSLSPAFSAPRSGGVEGLERSRLRDALGGRRGSPRRAPRWTSAWAGRRWCACARRPSTAARTCTTRGPTPRSSRTSGSGSSPTSPTKTGRISTRSARHAPGGTARCSARDHLRGDGHRDGDDRHRARLHDRGGARSIQGRHGAVSQKMAGCSPGLSCVVEATPCNPPATMSNQ